MSEPASKHTHHANSSTIRTHTHARTHAPQLALAVLQLSLEVLHAADPEVDNALRRATPTPPASTHVSRLAADHLRHEVPSVSPQLGHGNLLVVHHDALHQAALEVPDQQGASGCCYVGARLWGVLAMVIALVFAAGAAGRKITAVLRIVWATLIDLPRSCWAPAKHERLNTTHCRG